MNEQNRAYNASNPHQGDTKKVLCVCSAGLLRSPTAAVVLSQEPFNFNTRAAGVEESYALIPIDKVLLIWADEIVCMTYQHKYMLEGMIKELFPHRDDDFFKITVLDIPDNFAYRDPKLMELIAEKYKEQDN